MVDVDASVIVQLINFLFLIFALNIVLYKPIRKILLQRKDKIDGLKSGIDALSGESRDRDEAFAKGIKAARAKGLKEKEGLLSGAADEERKIVEAITEKAHAELAEVRKRVQSEADQVRKALLDQVDDYAAIIGQKILGRTVS